MNMPMLLGSVSDFENLIGYSRAVAGRKRKLFFNYEFLARHRKIKILFLNITFVFSFISVSFSQSANKFDFERIEDNSFLIEEAYNQEAGVIQHISSFQYIRDGIWQYTFTQEWPVPGQKNQLSATIPILRLNETGFGDIALNYRYQAILTNRLAFSPRFSLLLPTGYYRDELGTGAPGYQINLPLSYLISRKIVTHYNLGVTIVYNARDADGSKYDLINYNYGLSMIFLFYRNFNFMLEVAGNTVTTRPDAGNKKIINSLLLSPGCRYAINFKSGLQIVPGIAFPVGFGFLKDEIWTFGYLSFEHPLWKPKK
jgi:hypothetical protein